MAKKSKITSTHKKIAVIVICFGTSAYILINMFFIPKRVDPGQAGMGGIEAMLIPQNLTIEQYHQRRKQYADLIEKDKSEGKPENPMYARMIKALDNSAVGKEAIAASGGTPAGPGKAKPAVAATAASSEQQNMPDPVETATDLPPRKSGPPTAAELAEKPTVELDIVEQPDTVKEVPAAEAEAAKIIEEAPTTAPVSEEITYVQGTKGWDHAWQLKLPIDVVRSRDLIVVAVFKVNNEISKTEVLFSSDKLSRSKTDGYVDIAVNLTEKVAKNDKNLLTISTAITVRDHEKDFIFRRGINIGNEQTMKLKYVEKNGNVSEKNQLFTFDNQKGNVELSVETRFRS